MDSRAYDILIEFEQTLHRFNLVPAKVYRYDIFLDALYNYWKIRGK